MRVSRVKRCRRLTSSSMPDDALVSWPIRPQRSETVEGVVRDNAIVELRGIDQGGTLVVLPDGRFKGRIEAPRRRRHRQTLSLTTSEADRCSRLNRVMTSSRSGSGLE